MYLRALHNTISISLKICFFRDTFTLRVSLKTRLSDRSHAPRPPPRGRAAPTAQFHEAIAVDSSMRADCDAGWRGSTEPKPPGISEPIEGRGTLP